MTWLETGDATLEEIHVNLYQEMDKRMQCYVESKRLK